MIIMSYIINEELLKHFLIRGLPIPYMGVMINQPKISDLDNVELINFQSYGFIYCANKESIKYGEDEYINDFDNCTYFQTLFKIKNNELLNILIASLIFYLKVDLTDIMLFKNDSAIIIVDKKIKDLKTNKPKAIFQLDNENFEEFALLIRTICCMEKYKKKVQKRRRMYKNKSAQKMWEELMLSAEKQYKKKAKENYLDFADIENSVCLDRTNSYNYFNIGNLTIWQLYQEFIGSSVIEENEMIKDKMNSGQFQFKNNIDINRVKKTKIKIPNELQQNNIEND